MNRYAPVITQLSYSTAISAPNVHSEYFTRFLGFESGDSAASFSGI